MRPLASFYLVAAFSCKNSACGCLRPAPNTNQLTFIKKKMSKRGFSEYADAPCGPPLKRVRTASAVLPWSSFAECDGLFGDFIKTFLDPVSLRALLCASRHSAAHVTPHLSGYAYAIGKDSPLDQALVHAVKYDHVGLFRARWRRDGPDYDHFIERQHALQCALALLEMPARERGRALVMVSIKMIWSLARIIRPIHVDAFVSITSLQRWLHFHLHVVNIITETEEHNKAIMPDVLRAYSIYFSPPLDQAMRSFIDGGCKDEDVSSIRELLYKAHAHEQAVTELF